MSETQEPKGPVERQVRPFGGDALEPAWAACVSWALGQPEIRAQFKADTGHDIESLVRCSGFDRMIDEATGRTHEVFAAWCDWVTENIWGTA